MINATKIGIAAAVLSIGMALSTGAQAAPVSFSLNNVAGNTATQTGKVHTIQFRGGRGFRGGFRGRGFRGGFRGRGFRGGFRGRGFRGRSFGFRRGFRGRGFRRGGFGFRRGFGHGFHHGYYKKKFF